MPNETATKQQPQADASGGDVLVDIRNLKTFYPSRSGFLNRKTERVKAVDDVSLQILRGEKFGLVGESGFGKSLPGRSILRLEASQSGRILFEGENILATSPKRLKALRRDVQTIFQDPYGSLDPRMKMRRIVSEGLVVQGKLAPAERREFVEHLIDLVGLRREHLDRYPHEFCGAAATDRHRAGIAQVEVHRGRRASLGAGPVGSGAGAKPPDAAAEGIRPDHPVCCSRPLRRRVFQRPASVSCTSASSWSWQTRRSSTQMHGCQRSCRPAPNVTGNSKRGRIVLKGEVPNPLNPSSGCPFHTRCWMAMDICAQTEPELREIKPRHWAACHFAEELGIDSGPHAACR